MFMETGKFLVFLSLYEFLKVNIVLLFHNLIVCIRC